MRRSSSARSRHGMRNALHPQGLRLEWLEDRVVPSTLTLSLANSSVTEGLGTTATVTRTGDLSQPLTVQLSSSDTTVATLPGSVVLAAGQASATVAVQGVDDTLVDGTQQATLTAQATFAPTFVPAAASTQTYMTRTIASMPDGRYVTAGLKYVGPNTYSFDVGVSRFLPDGQPDTSFGGSGTVVTDVSGGQYDTTTSVLVQPDGKVLVAGYTTLGAGPYANMFVLRYDANGTLDTAFGSGGKVVLNFGSTSRSEVWDLALQSDGKIVLGGMIDLSDTVFGDHAVVRLTPSGTYDSTFGGTGWVTTNFHSTGTDTAYAVLVQPDGKIVLAGQGGGSNISASLSLARFNTNGSPDTTFGSGGVTSLNVPGVYEAVNDLALTPDGRILAVGKVQPVGAPSNNPYDWILAQFNANGTPDTTFGNGGTITYDLGGDDQAQAVVLMEGDTFAVAGYGVGNISASSRKPVLAQFSPDGRQVLTSLVVPRNDSLGYDLVYQNDLLRLAGAATSSLTGGFVDDFTPDPGEVLTATATLSVLDNDLDVRPDAYDVNEDETFTSTYSGFGVLANDYSVNGNLTASLVSGPAHGTLDLGPDGNFTYTPEPNYFGTDSFVYRATDGAGLSGEATVTLYVWGMDDRIQLSAPGPQTTAEDTPLTFSAANGNAFTITDIENPRVLVALLATPGILTLRSTDGLEFPYPDSVNNSNSITFYADNPAEANAALEGLVFTPAANFNGPTYVSILVRDESYVYGGPPIEEYANVPIDVTPVNDAPVAADDSYDAYEDQTLTVYGLGVLGNDSDPEYDPLSAVLVSGPAHGTLTLNPGGGFTYTPAPNYNGPDSFTYHPTDGASQGNVATVSLNVWGMDDPIQLSAPGPQTTAEDTSLTFSAANGNAIIVTDLESPRVLVALFVQNGILTLPNTAGLEFPYPESGNNSPSITFYADDPAEANAALEGLVFTPNPNYQGQVYLSILARDATSVYFFSEAYATVPIDVTPVNDAPVAADDSYDAYEDQTLTVSGLGVLGNDSDVDGDVLSPVLVSGPAHGTLTLNPNGGFTYTPAPNYFGPDSFVYRATDPAGLSAEATVSLNVWGMDDLIQVTAPGPQTIAEDTTLTFGSATGNAITVIDVDSPGVLVSLFVNDGILTVTNTAGVEFPDPYMVNNSPSIMFYADDPAEANAALNGLVFTPNPNFNGPVFFGVYVQDQTFVSYPVSAFASVSITVTPVNDAPVAVDDSYAAEAGVPFFATLGGGGNGLGVLVNDQDADWDPLSAVLVSGPEHGTLTFNTDGTFTYTAEATYSGTDTFTYRASDGQFQSGLATATFTVTLNRPPVSVGDAYAVNEDGSLSVSAPGVLGNDSDPEGQPLTAQLVSGPAHGTLTLNPNGTFTYTPAANYFGPDEFWYRASDGTNLGDPVAVTLTVNSVNDAPVAGNESYSTNEDAALTVNAPGVLGNDSDVEGGTLTAVLVAGPAHGTLTLNADGSFTYTPSANYSGSDSFTYKANDGQSDSNAATVSITVNTVNDAPVAVDDAYSVNEDQTLTIAPTPGVTSLTMVSQPGDYIGQGLTYSYTPQTGTFLANRNFDNGVSIYYSGGGHWWYLDFAAPNDATLTPGYYANATRWPFQASSVPGLDVSGDGRGSNTLTGNITVTQAVYAANGSVLRFAATFEQHSEGVAPALTGEIKFNQGDAASGILLNDSDAEGSPLTIVIVSNPAHGTLSMNVDGSFAYTPHANYHGPDSFSYKVSDGTTESNVATVSLTVNPVNDFPTANNDTYVLAEDNVLTVAAPGVLANDSDVDGDSLTTTLVTSPTHGTLAFNANGSFTYTPQANYNGSDSFQYAAYDGQAFSFIRTVTLVVTSVNDAPVANNDSYTTAEDTPLTVALPGVLGNDADVEGSALTAFLVSGPTHGTLTLNSNGSFVYTPATNYNGPDSFTYKANDGAADSSVATMSLTVSAVNDAPTATDDVYAVAEDQSLTVAAPGVLGNDGDVDGGSPSAVLVSGPVHGTLTLNADGSFTYTPSANYSGSDSFSYKANDGSLDSSVATVTLTVTPVNDAPLVDAGPDQTANEGSTVAFNGTTSDADGDTLSYSWDFGDGATATGVAPTHVYADNGTYTVTLTVSDDQGGSTSDSLVVTVLNVAPTLTLSGAGAVNEASAYTLSLAASDPGQDTIASWTITWGDGTVQTVAGNPGSVSHTYADGTVTYTISATAADEDGTYDAGNTLAVTVNNVAPTASVSGPATGARGQTRTFALGAADPSAVDQAGSFTFNVNWGDGNSEVSTGPASQQLGHVYTAAGTFTVQVTATDEDGGVSATVLRTITITAVDVQAGTLVIGGTTGDDTITVAPADASGNLAVTINGVSQGTFSPPSQVVVYGQSGNDQIKTATKKIGPTTYYVTVPARFFGDAGNDTLDARGSTANAILVGGAGTDTLQGGSGRDILIGGFGGDTLRGNGGDDVLIGNYTDFDSNLDALNALMAEWGRTDANYATRISHLNGSAGGLNGGYFLDNTTVHDDSAIDQLYGNAGSDWFIYTASGSNRDRLNDFVTGEVATPQ